MRRAACTWLLLLAACAPRVTATTGLPAREVARRITAPAEAGDVALAIERAHAGAEPQLIAYDVAAQRERFRVAVAEGAEVSAQGDLALVQAGATLTALDLASGRPRYRIALPRGRYVGAARAGDRIALVTVSGRPLDPDARSLLTIIAAHTGASRGSLALPGDAGRPIAAGGFVLVPSQRQRISVVDVERGVEVARLRAQSDAIEWLDVQRGDDGAPALLFGGQRFHRLVSAEAQPSALGRLPDALTALPGRPSAPHSAYEPQAGRRIGLHITLVPSGPNGATLLADRAYYTFYNLLFAFDGRGTLLRARTLPSDVIAARVHAEGLALALASGELQLRSHGTGALLASRTLAVGEAGLRSVELPARVLPAGTEERALPEGTEGALARSLIEAASARDARLVPARIYAVEQLAALPDELITGALLDLYEQPSTPAELQSAIATALSRRQSGLPALIAALERRYDFIEGTRPAPLAIIAPALARAGERAAAPGLLERLWDHETPVTALPSLLRALAVLGDEASSALVLAWLEQYRADSSLRAEPEALAEAARTAYALDPEAARAPLEELARAPDLPEPAAVAIRALIAPAAPAAVPPAAEAPVAATPPRPRLPSQRALDAAFAARLDAIEPCVAAELVQNPKLRQLRIAFIAEGDGSAHAFHFAPASGALADCLYPKVASIRLPAFTEPRSVEQVVINLEHPDDQQASTTSATDGSRPWWARGAREPRAKTRATPWWHTEQPLPPRLDEGAGSALEIEAGAQPPPHTVIVPPQAPEAPALPVPAAPAPDAPAQPTAPPPAEEPEQWWVPKAE